MKQRHTSMERPNPAGWDGTGFPRAERTLTARLWGLLALAVCLCLTLSLMPAPAQAAATPEGSWADHAQTAWYNDASNSFTISTAEELAGLANLVNGGNDFAGKTVVLDANIDISSHYWPGIGYEDVYGSGTNPFSGTFDGGGHTISNMTMYNVEDSGLFGFLEKNAKILNVRLYAPSIKYDKETGHPVYVGAIAGFTKNATISDCVAEQVNMDIHDDSSSGWCTYVGGLSGKDGKISNCAVLGLTAKITSTGSNDGRQIAFGGIAASTGTLYNCFVSLTSLSVDTGPITTNMSYLTCDVDKWASSFSNSATNCYWSGPAFTEVNPTTEHDCHSVTADQIIGTGTKIIAPSSAYANTPSLMKAMNNWVADQVDGTYSNWVLRETGMLYPKVVAPPDYIDISGPLDEVTHQSATGDIETGMELEGQVQENVTLLSVTMPASIPFIVDVDGAGAFKRVLSATGTLTNRSDCPVDITLTAVTDEGKLLEKVALALIPDPAPSGDKPQIALTKGAGKNDLLAALAAPTGGVPTTATVKVDGTDGSNGASIGSDGDAFVVGLTLKVSKQ